MKFVGNCKMAPTMNRQFARTMQEDIVGCIRDFSKFEGKGHRTVFLFRLAQHEVGPSIRSV